jgi:hypothetical protein
VLTQTAVLQLEEHFAKDSGAGLPDLSIVVPRKTRKLTALTAIFAHVSVAFGFSWKKKVTG